MLHRQSGVFVNQKDLLDPEQEVVAQHHFPEAHPGAHGFEAPQKTAHAEAVFQHLIQRLDEPGERFGDALANRRPDDRVEQINYTLPIFLHRGMQRLFHHRHQRVKEGLIGLFGHQRDGFGQYPPDLGR